MQFDRLLFLLCSIAGAVFVFWIAASCAVRSIRIGLELTLNALEWEIKTDVGKINVMATVLLFVLILASPALGFVLDFLRIGLAGPGREQPAPAAVYPNVYVWFGLYVHGLLIITALFEHFRGRNT